MESTTRARRVAHLCHAKRCDVRVPPKMLMCRKHWYMVPPDLRAAVWATYRPGQEIDKDPSAEYLAAALDAIDAVAERERQREGQREDH